MEQKKKLQPTNLNRIEIVNKFIPTIGINKERIDSKILNKRIIVCLKNTWNISSGQLLRNSKRLLFQSKS